MDFRNTPIKTDLNLSLVTKKKRKKRKKDAKIFNVIPINLGKYT